MSLWLIPLQLTKMVAGGHVWLQVKWPGFICNFWCCSKNLTATLKLCDQGTFYQSRDTATEEQPPFSCSPQIYSLPTWSDRSYHVLSCSSLPGSHSNIYKSDSMWQSLMDSSARDWSCSVFGSCHFNPGMGATIIPSSQKKNQMERHD